MSYDILITIVVINAFVTVALWRQVTRKANRPLGPNKTTATALWRSNPIVPRHDPPKGPGGEHSGLADDVDRVFFVDFKEFADVLNWWFTEDESPFRLQDVPDADMGLNVAFDSPTFGRRFALYYNQVYVGLVEVHPSYDYTTENPNVSTSVRIDWPRLFSSYELVKFLEGIALHVTSSNPKSIEHVAVRQSIHYALIETLWKGYRLSEFDRALDDVEDWGELNLSVHGVAEFYMARKSAPAFRRSPDDHGGGETRKARGRRGMGPIRRTISLIVALGLSALGLGGVVYLLFFAAGRTGWMVMGSGMMAFLGLYWLWADFINADPRPEN